MTCAGEQGSRGAGEQGSRGAGEQGSRGAEESSMCLVLSPLPLCPSAPPPLRPSAFQTCEKCGISTSTNTKGYFCTICLTASGQARINSNDPSKQFVDIHITKSQALQLLEQLKTLLDETDGKARK